MGQFTVHQQATLDSLSRALDAIEARTPLINSYARIDPYIIHKREGGIDLDFLVYNIESKLWYDREGPDWSMHFMSEPGSVPDGGVVLDFGCNSGFTTAWYALKVGRDGHVHAFDCMPWNAAATEAQAKLNHIANVSVYAEGVSNRNGHIEIDPSGSQTLASDDAERNTLTVPLIDVKDLKRLRPSFIKCDIEGAEAEVAKTDFSEFAELQAILLEFHTGFISARGLDPAETIQDFIKSGFIPRQNSRNGRILTVDEIVATGVSVYFSRV